MRAGHYRSIISKILSGNEAMWDEPNIILLGTHIINEYGAVLEKTSTMVYGASESLLPYPKEEIRKTIDLLLHFMKNEISRDKFKSKYPEEADKIFTNEYYSALKAGYIELAKFIPNDEAKLTAKALLLFDKPKNQVKTIDNIRDLAKELSSPWFEKFNKIQHRIAKESSLLLEEIQGKYGKEDKLFDD
jgi:hypothetical protein